MIAAETVAEVRDGALAELRDGLPAGRLVAHDHPLDGFDHFGGYGAWRGPRPRQHFLAEPEGVRLSVQGLVTDRQGACALQRVGMIGAAVPSVKPTGQPELLSRLFE